MLNIRNLPLLVLTAIHVVGVPVYAWNAEDDLGRLLVVSGIWGGQISLLGFVGAMARCSWRVRLAAVVMFGAL